MKSIKTEDAIGAVLGHDITEIIPGVFKGAAFKKGHVIQEKDIEKLLRIGKEHVYVFELSEDELHENDAALFLGNLFAGQGIYYTEPSEGKISFKPKEKGLLKINRELQEKVNDIGDICLATVQGDRNAEKDELLGGCRIFPLVIKKEKIKAVETLMEDHEPILSIKPYLNFNISLIVTGSEVYKGRIKDQFGPVVEEKLKKYGLNISDKTILPDEPDIIKNAILEAKQKGAELIVVTGGMSIDPDDKTPGAIKATGANIITYGTPVLPGAMLLFAYLDGIPVFGLPGCVMYAKVTAFDLLLPRVLAGEIINRKDISRMGYGGQCLSCDVCRFPNCSFGKH